VSCCKALPTRIYGRKSDITGIFRPASQTIRSRDAALETPRAGHPGRRVGEPSSVRQRPAGADAPQHPEGRRRKQTFGAFQSCQPRHSWGLRKGGSEGGKNPAKLPMLKATLPVTSTGIPDTQPSWGPTEDGHLHTVQEETPSPGSEPTSHTCCPLSAHRGPRDPTLTSSTKDGLTGLDASSHDATLPPYPPTLSVLDGDLGGPQQRTR